MRSEIIRYREQIRFYIKRLRSSLSQKERGWTPTDEEHYADMIKVCWIEYRKLIAHYAAIRIKGENW